MDISRRKFISNGVGVLFSSSQLLTLAARAASFEPRTVDRAKILVVIQMSGGNDGLNTVIPYGFGQYYQLRPNIGIEPNELIPLTGAIGLHPSMDALNAVYQAGKLAIALGVGYPNPNPSHFRSIEIWQTGEPEKISQTGWIGRYLDNACSKSDSLSKCLFPAINVDPMLPKSLSAARVAVPSVSDANQFRFNTDLHYRLDRQKRIESFNHMYSCFEPDRPSARLLQDVGLDAMQVSDSLVGVVNNYKSEVAYPCNGFGRSMKFIAQMIVANVDARVYNLSLGGFDTHANQLPTQSGLLKQFSDSLAAFQKDLEYHGVDQDVMVMAFSEFGRRVEENDGGGTDHGTAQPVFLMGSKVKGGLYGDYPSLTNLESGGLKHAIDFRQIYSTCIDRWLVGDSRTVLGDRYDHLPFIL